MTPGMIELYDRLLLLLDRYDVEEAEQIATTLVEELEEDGIDVTLPEGDEDELY